MCGIAGWISPNQDVATLRAMTDAIQYRGPDGAGHAFLPLDYSCVAALGHRRLSIIDLGTGDQPMASHDNRFCIVFNGEIYNYIELREELLAQGAHFRTLSDTEVILEAWRHWGRECLLKFRGMFAFALYDAHERTIHLARDHFGEKPLFFVRKDTNHGANLIFASEIVSILAHPDVSADLDIASLHDFLCWRYVPAPNTFFKDIEKIPPGTCLTWKSGAIENWRFWFPPEEIPGRQLTSSNPWDDFLQAFDEAVKIRLRADVPIGSFLSGGLDSTCIAASLAHLGASNVRTFSIGFEGDPASELPLAENTARVLGTVHTPIELSVDSLFNLLPQLSRHRGAPISETADMPIYCMSLEASRHVKVILSGEGADEIFAGYPKHLAEHYLGRYAASDLLGLASKALLAITSHKPARARRLRIAAEAMRHKDFDQRMVAWFGAMTAKDRTRLWTGPFISRDVISQPFRAAPGASALRRVLHFDQSSWLPDNLLERMDRMTMAASIEARTPFMDIRLAEFAASLPDHWRINGRTTKHIIRKALAPRIPSEVLSRRKNGFRMPVTEWFRGPLREPFKELILSPDSVSGDYLDTGLLNQMIDAHASGRKNYDKSLWAFFALEVFLREFFRK